MPNQTISIGASAKTGTEPRAITYGLERVARAGKYKRENPIKLPITTPSKKPTKASLPVTHRCPKSSPLAILLINVLITEQGDAKRNFACGELSANNCQIPRK